jgi:hypothetical protein
MTEGHISVGDEERESETKKNRRVGDRKSRLINQKLKKTPWFLARKRTIPIERSPPVSEASANFSG